MKQILKTLGKFEVNKYTQKHLAFFLVALSGMLLLNPPFGLEHQLALALAALRAMLGEGEGRGDARIAWAKPRD